MIEGGMCVLTSGERFLLLAGAFAVLALIFTMYMPLNSFFTLPPAAFIAIYAAAGGFFLLYAKFRKNPKASFVLLWLLCAVFIIAAALFITANIYAL